MKHALNLNVQGLALFKNKRYLYEQSKTISRFSLFMPKTERNHGMPIISSPGWVKRDPEEEHEAKQNKNSQQVLIQKLDFS